MNFNSTFTIDTQKVNEHLEYIFSNINSNTKVIPVLKANAYGHGLIEIAHLFEDNNKIEILAVAQLSEAMKLIEHKTSKRIMLLCGITQDQIETVINHHIEPIIHNMESLQKLDEVLKDKGITHYPVHLKINTGLNRLGFWYDEELDEAINYLKNTQSFKIVSTYSHFIEGAKKDSEISYEQNRRFLKAIQKLEINNLEYGFKHICDSGAYEWYKEAHYDAIRIGRALYMDNPDKPEEKRYHDVGSWHATLISKRKLKKGDSLGYGQGFVCNKDMEIGIINIGYGDGLLFDLVDINAPILINNTQTQLLSIAMDQSYIDLTNIDANIEDTITIFGLSLDGIYNSSHEIAKLMDDEGVTLTTFISPRVKRIYK